MGRAVAKLAPQTIEEAEAIAGARELVRMIRDEQVSFMGLPLSFFDKADTRQMWKQWLRITAQDPGGLLDLCNDGRGGDAIAHEVCCDLILEYRTARTPLPPQLEVYDMEIVHAARDPERRGRGRPKSKVEINLRDIALVYLIGEVCWKSGFKPNRNPLSKRPSGCSIVLRALELENLVIGDSTLTAVWARLGRRAFPPEILARPDPW